MRKRLATVAFVVAAFGDCGTATSSPGPSGSATPTRVPVIPLPTRLPDVISFANTLPLYEYDSTVPEPRGALPRRRRDLGDGRWSSEQVALSQRYAQTDEHGQFLLRLDALGDQFGAGVAGEMSHPGDHGLAGRVRVDVAYQ